MKPQDLQNITSAAIDRYSKRFAQFGYDARSLGWGTSEQQEYRFAQTLLGSTDWNNKSILDVGCGFGDLHKFLKKTNIHPGFYTGIDINPDLIEEAKKQLQDNNTEFRVANLMAADFSEENFSPKADIVVMLGILNFNIGEKDNYQYSELAMNRAWSLTKDTLIVDFLSTHRDPSYPEESFVFYHDPLRMLEFALTLSPFVTLKHNYQSIPQREFMLFIQKQHDL